MRAALLLKQAFFFFLSFFFKQQELYLKVETLNVLPSGISSRSRSCAGKTPSALCIAPKRKVYEMVDFKQRNTKTKTTQASLQNTLAVAIEVDGSDDCTWLS